MAHGTTVIMEDWTYSGNPSASTQDKVRFLIGDTNEDKGLVTDSEIAWALSEEGDNAYRAAALVCDAVASLKAQEADMSVGDLKISASQIATNYTAKARTLRSQALRRGVSIHAGGISVDRKDTVEDDSDRVEPFFTRGTHVNPATDYGWSTERT